MPATSGGSSPGGGGNGLGGSGGNSTSGGGAQAGSTSTSGSGGAPSAGASSGGAGTGGSNQGGQAGAPTGGTAGAAGSAGTGGADGLPPLTECPNTPSIDRLTSWVASGEGLTVPATGSLLVKDGADYVGKVQFIGAEWHVIPVLIAKDFDSSTNLSNAASFTLTYSATAALHVQLRSQSHWNGGDQYATDIPSTGGQKQTKVFSFAAAGWKSLFGAPALSYAATLKEGLGMVFVGDTDNTVVFYGLRIDGFTPSCP
jgi:hypothetical protein